MMIVPIYTRGIGTIKWKAIERERIALERKYTRTFYNFLRQMWSELEQVMQDSEIENIEKIAPGIVDSYRDKLRKLIIDVNIDIMKYFGERILKELYKFQFDPYNQGCMNWASQNAANKVVGILEATKNIIRKAIEDTIQNNKDTPYAVNKIKAAGFTQTRALRIARTELVGASNAGSKFAMDQTGLQYEKTWVSARDPRVREAHRNADGQTVPQDELFTVMGEKLEFPGDNTHGAGAANVVNCRCTTVFKVKPGVVKPKIVRPLPAEDIRNINLENTIVEGPHGTVLKIDKHAVENQRFVLKRVEIDDEEHYIAYFKLTEPEAKKLVNELIVSDKVKEVYEIPTFDVDVWNISREKLRGRFEYLNGKCLKYESKDYTLYFIHDEQLTSLRGQILIISKNKTAAEKALADIGKLNLLTKPVEDDVLKAKLMQLIWQEKPKLATELKPDMSIDEIKKKLGKSADDVINKVKAMGDMQVLPNYSTYVIDRTEEIKKAGGVELFSGISGDAKRVVSIFKDFDGLICLNERMLTTGFGGSSANADIESGGANYFFTRLVTETGVKNRYKYSRSFAAQGYRVHIDIAELNRTDWFAYHDDMYGTVTGETFVNRDNPIDFVKKQNEYPTYSNEVMFKNGINIKSIKFISCDYEHMRQQLINEFKSQGITEINGKRIEDFVVVKKEW